tara:strand:- start:745 stop:1077 length:333 start_codon:yes stop_codon:yes gene_type:complete
MSKGLSVAISPNIWNMKYNKNKVKIIEVFLIFLFLREINKIIILKKLTIIANIVLDPFMKLMKLYFIYSISPGIELIDNHNIDQENKINNLRVILLLNILIIKNSFYLLI